MGAGRCGCFAAQPRKPRKTKEQQGQLKKTAELRGETGSPESKGLSIGALRGRVRKTQIQPTNRDVLASEGRDRKETRYS